MEFKRINDVTIRCILTPEDMKEYNLELDDFFNNNDKFRTIITDILMKAKEEIDYEVNENALSVQIMPLPSKSIAITFSDTPEDALEDIVSRIKKGGNVKDIIDKIDTTNVGIDVKDLIENDVEADNENIAIYSYKSFEDINRMLLTSYGNKHNNIAIFKGEKGIYYVILALYNSPKEELEKLFIHAMDYGEKLPFNAGRMAYISEKYPKIYSGEISKLINML